MHTQHPGGSGEECRVLQRAPGILSNSFSLLASLPSAAEGPPLPPNVGELPSLSLKAELPNLCIMAQGENDHICSA